MDDDHATLDLIKHGARTLAAALTLAGVTLIIAAAIHHPVDIVALVIGLSCLNGALAAIIGVGAVHGHQTIIRSVRAGQRALAQQLTEIAGLERSQADRLATVVEVAASDDLSTRRRGGQ